MLDSVRGLQVDGFNFAACVNYVTYLQVVTSTKNIALDRIEVEPSPTGEMCIQFRPVLSRHVTGGVWTNVH